ncbi:MAG TPA: hypothetical protein PKM63_21735 [Panacibacter sp.]|nr:hypothetical protein [Panacibacter sp.]HNP46934.1 hypothetical protein [Panacibacter sp.]
MLHTTINIKQQYSYNTKQVLFLTGMNEDQFFGFMTDTAYAWLEHYWANVIDIKALIECSEFLAWWKLQWYERDDREYVKKLYHEWPALRNYFYRVCHQTVFNDRFPMTQFLFADFRERRKDFELAIAKQKIHA